MFGIEAGELMVLLAVAAVVLGPERLPEYTQQLGRLIRELRRMAQGAQAQVRAELGPEFDDVDWRKLDPRRYDPRRIVREALADTDLDPDDPLGLHGLDLRPADLLPDVSAVSLLKPVSPGGPRDHSPQRGDGAGAGPEDHGAPTAAAPYVEAEREATAARVAAARDAAAGLPPAAGGEASVSFDPDAT